MTGAYTLGCVSVQPGTSVGKLDLDVAVEKSPVEQRSQVCGASV